MIDLKLRQTRLERIGARIRKQDKFGDGFHMKLSDGEDGVTSWMGTLCSIFLVIVLVMYTAQKIQVLVDKKGVSILTALNDSVLDPDFKFSYKQGFNIAVKWYSTKH